VLPKPLLPVGDKAILDVVVHQLRGHGFTDLTFAVGYLSHLIQAVFGDGSARGVSIDYHEESQPLGTAGPLATIDAIDDTFLVMNGDVLTTLDYGMLYEAHQTAGNLLTIAAHRRVVRTDYGVIHTEPQSTLTDRVIGYEEKPEIPYVVSMGVYVAEPAVRDYIPVDERLDIPDLVLRILADGGTVGSFLFDGYWLDVGRHDDYEKAIAEYEQLKHLLYQEEARPKTEA
jgi:NDP-sugar pyrophosphorylase family protein